MGTDPLGLWTTGNAAQGASCRWAVFAGFVEVTVVAMVTVASQLSGGLFDPSVGCGFTDHPFLLQTSLALVPETPSFLGPLQPSTALPAALLLRCITAL